MLVKKLREVPQIAHELKLAVQNRDSEQISRIISDLVPVSVAMAPRRGRSSQRPKLKDPYGTPRWTPAHQRGFDISQRIIRPKVESVLRDALPRIRELVPDGDIGFRGSLARGYKGWHKYYVPFEPENFDVDGFIISDKLAEKIPKSRSGRRYITDQNAPELAKQQDRIWKNFGKSGIKSDPFQFRVFSRDEFAKIEKDPHSIIKP